MLDLSAPDTFPAHCHTEVTHASPERAVSVQRASDDLDNHVEVRHASALFTAAYAAARALLDAALARSPTRYQATLAECDIAYKEIPQDELVSVAVPEGEGWSTLGGTVSLACSVRSVNALQRRVATTTIVWHLRPAA
jgi:hypothetical protein